MHLPQSGLGKEQVLATLKAYKAHDVPWREGRVMAGVYDPGQATEDLSKAAYLEFLSENALYPNFYPSLLGLEREVVRMVANLLQGDEAVVGNLTSGGTESIMLAVKAARDWARANKPQIAQPEMVLCITAHPAFHKAAHYLGIKPVVMGMDLQTFRADLAAMQAAMTPNTILLVGSAPCYSHGVVDPIPEIAALAQENGILCHVDGCVGGIHLSIMRKLGHAVPAFDWSVPGITSLSVDLHKYGYAAKNASVILYHSAGLRRFAMFSCSSTTGYAVINPTVLSSKSGGPIAGAWATLNSLGEEGYGRIVAEVQAATQRMLEGIAKIPDLKVLGQPDMCMFTMTSNTLSVFELDDAMAKRGWFLQPQFSAGGGPANLHVSVNHSNVAHVEDFLAALRESVEAVKANGGLGDVAGLKARVEALLQNPGPDAFMQIATLAGLNPGQMPQGFAQINCFGGSDSQPLAAGFFITVLDMLPDPMVDFLLIEYLNGLYV